MDFYGLYIRVHLRKDEGNQNYDERTNGMERFDMRASSNNLYNLIKKSKAEVISVKVKYESMPEETSYIST